MKNRTYLNSMPYEDFCKVYDTHKGLRERAELECLFCDNMDYMQVRSWAYAHELFFHFFIDEDNNVYEETLTYFKED